MPTCQLFKISQYSHLETHRDQTMQDAVKHYKYKVNIFDLYSCSTSILLFHKWILLKKYTILKPNLSQVTADTWLTSQIFFVLSGVRQKFLKTRRCLHLLNTSSDSVFTTPVRRQCVIRAQIRHNGLWKKVINQNLSMYKLIYEARGCPKKFYEPLGPWLDTQDASDSLLTLISDPGQSSVFLTYSFDSKRLPLLQDAYMLLQLTALATYLYFSLCFGNRHLLQNA